MPPAISAMLPIYRECTGIDQARSGQRSSSHTTYQPWSDTSHNSRQALYPWRKNHNPAMSVSTADGGQHVQDNGENVQKQK